jgi:2-oxo-3-hexenedioate decarboxylase
MLDDTTIETLAACVDDAAREAEPIKMLSADIDGIDFEQAYRVQRASIRRRLDRGERLVGMKMGLTSRAKMEQVGVHEPIYGHLTDAMILDDGAAISIADHVHPRVEPELAFVLADDLRGPITTAQALEAVEGVCAALEIIDSRYKNFEFTLPDVVADNASSSRFVLGSEMRSPDELELGNLGMAMSVGGEVRQIGSSAAIYEHPARSLAALANMLADVGESLSAGMIVLAGGATAAEHLEAGDRVTLRVDGLGRVQMRAEE